MELKKTLLILFLLTVYVSSIQIYAQENNNMEIYYAKTSKEIDASKLKTEKSSKVFIDKRDGHEYKWVKIGNQTWMAENLAYLPEVCPPEEECGYYVYDYRGISVQEAGQEQNYNDRGVLYNFKAASTACPPGWHLPTDEEWKILEYFLVQKKKN
jgi:hypothetical protein